MDKPSGRWPRMVAAGISWTLTAATDTATGGILIGLAWAGLSRPIPVLIILTLTTLAATLLFWILWPWRPQLTWSLAEWLGFAGGALITLWLLNGWGLPWFFHCLQGFAQS